MSAVGLIGILFSVLAFPFAFEQRSRGKTGLFVLLLLLHLGAAVVYYLWVQTNTADTIVYYFDPYDMYGEPVRPGTMFVIWLVQSLKLVIGGTYLDYFLIFQAAGFWGLVFLMRTFEEISLELGIEQPKIAYLLLFLPGLHFWTSAIGKDAPLFLGASLAVWAVMQLRRRFFAFVFAIVLMALFRPHIALVATVALAGAAFFEARTRGWVKAALLVAAFTGTAVVAATVETAFQVDVSNAESVGEFFTRYSEVTQKIGGGTAVVGASFPVRLISLLFRPFFFDAGGLFGLISSMENVLMLFIVGTLLVRAGDCVRLSRRIFFLRFAAIFALLLILLLAFVYHNVGLGLRQRVMFMPGLLTLFTAVVAVRAARLRELAHLRRAAAAEAFEQRAPAV